MADGLLDWIKTPEGQGLLSAAFGGLAGARRGQPLNSIGRAGVAGLSGYADAVERQDQTAQNAQMKQYREMQIADMKSNAADKERLRLLEQQRREILPSLYAGTYQGGSVSIPDAGGVPMFSQGVSVDRPSTLSGAGQFDAQRAIRSGLFKPEEIKQYADLANVGLPEVARTVEVDDGNGGKATLQLDKFGRPVGRNLPSYIAPVQVNQGDRVTFARPAPGVSLPVNMSPSERDASARGWAGLREQQNAVTYQQDADGNYFALPTKAAPGSVIRAMPVAAGGGGMTPLVGKGAQPTEDQSKAAGWLVQANNAHSNMLKAIKADPDAARPGFNDALAGIPSMGAGNGLANIFRSSSRQQFLQGASSLSEALLRAATGAGVNKDEAAQKARELTPQIGDSDEVIKQKMASIPLYIESLKVRAGPAAKSVQSIMRPQQGKSANPADPLNLFGGAQ